MGLVQFFEGIGMSSSLVLGTSFSNFSAHIMRATGAGRRRKSKATGRVKKGIRPPMRNFSGRCRII